ncbi:unnamed protein product [Darwinula stevensoni]|uniref:Xylose isomerase n=1 Tax=Darwinula stevensoni TaxID=69355 RepID=A0A7R9AI74_9CRUS|nr:unnamed protein product [Darwinula stevensoni]CAG0906349.1 unnamed protein product [Darwinula stevensoni]
MLVLGPWGGFTEGGVNFDAKVRRNSTDPEDIFVAHIAGMDTFARALVTAEKIIQESDYTQIRTKRYQSFDQGEGARFEKGELNLEALRLIAEQLGEPAITSGKQEKLEQMINQYL